MSRAVRKMIIESILWTLILTTVVGGLDIPNSREIIEATARRMKAEAPETLSIKYHDHEDGQVVEVIFKKVLNTIPSSLLPIWDIQKVESEPIESRLNNFLAICYHGVNSHSAITYFPHTETLHGVIDYRFYIKDLRRIHSEEPDVVKLFMHPMTGNEIRPDSLHTRNRERRMVDEFAMFKHLYGPLHKKCKETLYAEILLVIDTTDHTDHYNTGAPHEKSVMYALAYWNAVDMLFSHLKRTEIRINLAGIAVGWTKKVVENLVPFRIDIYGDTQVYIINQMALDGVGKFVEDPQIEAPRFSYDFLIWMTQASLLTPGGQNADGPDLGISAEPADCGGFHDEEDSANAILNRAVVMHDAKYSNYHTAARVLASMMFVSIDDIHRPDSLSEGLSRGIMDPSNLRIEGCLRWSYQSEVDFAKYASSKSSCCLLNFPYRTMEKPLTPVHKLTVHKQCRCYKMGASEHVDHSEHYCATWLHCKDEDDSVIAVASLLDGTPCPGFDGRGICRSSVCV